MHLHAHLSAYALCFIHCDTGSAKLVCLCAVISSDALCPLPPPLISPSAEDTTSPGSHWASFLSDSLSTCVFFLIKCYFSVLLLCISLPLSSALCFSPWVVMCVVFLGWWFWRAGPLITRRLSATFTSWQAMRTVTRLILADTAPSPSHCSGIVDSELSGSEPSSLSQYAACLSKGLKTKTAEVSDRALIIPWKDLSTVPCCAFFCQCHCLMARLESDQK